MGGPSPLTKAYTHVMALNPPTPLLFIRSGGMMHVPRHAALQPIGPIPAYTSTHPHLDLQTYPRLHLQTHPRLDLQTHPHRDTPA